MEICGLEDFNVTRPRILLPPKREERETLLRLMTCQFRKVSPDSSGSREPPTNGVVIKARTS